LDQQPGSDHLSYN